MWYVHHSLSLLPSGVNMDSSGIHIFPRFTRRVCSSIRRYHCWYGHKTLCIDDSIHWNDKTETAFWHILEYISHCSKNSIVFNTELFHFGEVVEFAGFWITKDGVKLRFHQFPTHTNITSVRYWHRLVNQVSYAFTQAEIMVSFWELLC